MAFNACFAVTGPYCGPKTIAVCSALFLIIPPSPRLEKFFLGGLWITQGLSPKIQAV